MLFGNFTDPISEWYSRIMEGELQHVSQKLLHVSVTFAWMLDGALFAAIVTRRHSESWMEPPIRLYDSMYSYLREDEHWSVSYSTNRQ
jgi:hypothetical protein